MDKEPYLNPLMENYECDGQLDMFAVCRLYQEKETKKEENEDV